MKTVNKAILSFSLVLLAAMSASAGKDNDPVLMTIDNKPIKLSEFEYLYNKNNSQQQATQPVDDYLDMFINYKLKVAEAESKGLDQNEAFRSEYATYCKDLAQPYIIDPQLKKDLVKLTYDRMGEEVDVSHIMIPLATGKNEIVKQKAFLDSIRTAIIDGRADFAAEADKYSIDPGVKRNHGHMGVITGGRYPIVFEDAAYSTPVGEISPVIETPFGYHIVLVNGRQPASGEVLVQHILKLTQGASPEKIAAQKAAIDSIYVLLQNGADFDELAKAESEDPGSARQGGHIDWFGKGRMVPEFEEISYTLQDGETSKPFTTSYGYHIVRRLDHRGIAPFNEVQGQIGAMIDRDERQFIPVRKTNQKLRQKYNASFVTKNIDAVENEITKAGKLDASLIEKYVKDTRPVITYNKPIATATVSDVFSSIAPNNRTMSADDACAFVENRLEELANDAVMQAARDNLAKENSEYRNLLNEYRDGMLLFEISDANVWEKSKTDKEGLDKFFRNNRNKYTTWTTPKFKGFIIFANSDSIKNEAQQYLAENPVPRDQVVDVMKQKFGKNVRVERVLAAKGDNDIIDAVAFGGEMPELKGKWIALFPYDEKIIDQPEEPADERGAVTADYQSYLESNWLKDLHKSHKVKVNKKVLEEFKKSVGEK